MLAIPDLSLLNYLESLKHCRDVLHARPGGPIFRRRRSAISWRPMWVLVTRTARRLCLMPAAVCALLALGASVPANAQSVSFNSAQVPLGAGLSSPTGVAVNAAGDVFVADSGLKQVVKIPAGCAISSCQTTVGTGLTNPLGVAVDGLGNVFIEDGNTRVLKVASGGAQSQVNFGSSGPTGVAADAAGDLFISSTGSNIVFKLTPGCTTSTCETSFGTGLSSPAGVAVDGAGDVFIVDAGNSRVVKVPAGGGAQITLISSTPNLTGVAVDGAGRVFVTSSSALFSEVIELPVGCASNNCAIPAGSELSNAEGVATDGAADVFVADTGNHRVVKIQPVSASIGKINVCSSGQTTPVPCNQKLTLTYTIGASVTFAANPVVVTQGAPNLDFTLSATTCTGAKTTSNVLCSVDVLFTPREPWLRMGAVQLSDSTGHLLVTTFIHGIGEGPAVAFDPGAQSTVGTGLSSPTVVAVDAAGDVFIVDGMNADVVKVPAGGGAQSIIANGLDAPVWVAVDGEGDVFITQQGPAPLVKVPPGCTTSACQTGVGSGLFEPTGVAVDGAGNVFVADFSLDHIVEVPQGCAIASCQINVTSGLFTPAGVAVDGAGDLFIADGGNSRVLKLAPGCIAASCQTTVGNNFSQPLGLAVDGAGDVFVSDFSLNIVVKIPPGCAGGSCETTIGSGLNGPGGLALDGTGNLFIADFKNHRVLKIQRSQPPVLEFTATPEFETSIDSPQSVTLQNIGNQLLNSVSPGLVIGAPSFGLSSVSGGPAMCTGTFSLAPGASCDLSVSFNPTTEFLITTAATLTDNALNAASASQTIQLSGTGVGPATISGPRINSLSPAKAFAGGASFTLTVNGSGFVDGGAVNFNGSLRATTFINGTQVTASITAADIASAGSNQITYGPIDAILSNAVTFPVFPSSTSPTTVQMGPLRYVPITPCRLGDTRNLPSDPLLGSTFTGGTSRNITISPNTACAIPATAAAFSLNVAVIPSGPLGFLTVWPAGQTQPVVATVSSPDGRVRSNAAIVPAGTSGSISVFASNTTDLVLDINGYFTTDPSQLTFFPVTPCRLVDTRNANGQLGGPFLSGNTSRTFPLLSSPCNLPSAAQAYSLNLTAVPKGPLGFLTAFPTGQAQPGTANLSATTGTVTANAAIIPAGANGSIDIFASNNTDLVIDVDGYFAPSGLGGLSLYTVSPCRVLDTRQVSNAPSAQSFSGELDEALQVSACGVPGSARAYVLNSTVVPPVPLGFLTLWLTGTTQPLAATLSALDQTVTSNMAIVPASNGAISAFAANPTQLILDMFGFFAP